MTTLRPLRGGSPSFDVVVDGDEVGLVTMAPPAPAYERLARRGLWYVYLFGEMWTVVEPHGQALFVGSYDRLAAAIEAVEYLHARRGCRWCYQRPHKQDCTSNEAVAEQAVAAEQLLDRAAWHASHP